MDKEKILERIKQLEDEKLRVQATYTVLEGAIQDSKYWLSQLEGESNGENNSE